MDNENEIESLWLSLGIKPDDSSASDAVDKIIKAVQSKLKSSIYGGKNGVITLPATIEGKFKDGREIDKSITDAYAAIYEKAKQMADESVSLTLKDIKDFKAQIDKFGKQTAKYRNNDVIANANNNLRQTVATYQNYINELKGEVAKTKKIQVKQTQKVKAKQKAKTKKSSYNNLDISDEEIESDIQNERKRRLSGIKQVEPKGYKHYVGFEGGVATKKTLQETEYSGSYPSGFARQTAKSRREARKRELASLRVEKNKEKAEQHVKDLEEGKVKYKTKRQVIDKKPNGQWDVRYEDAEVYNKKPKQYTNEEKNELKRDVATNELAKILGGLEHRRKDASVQLFKNYMSGAFAFNTAAGKNDWDVIRESLEKTLNRYRGDKGTLGITDGTEKGVSEGHEEAVAAIEEMLDYMDEIIKQSEKQGKISAENARVLKELAKIDPRAANKYANELLGVGQQNTNSSNTVEPNSQLAKDIATITSATEETYRAIRNSTKETGEVNRSVKIGNTKTAVEFDQAEKISKENKDINSDTAKSVKANETTGFDTDELSNRLIKVVEDVRDNLSKAKETTSKIELPANTKDLYKALPDPNRLLGLPKPDGRRKKISDGMKDENPQLSLVPVQDALKKSLAVIPGEFAKTLKESIYPSVKDVQYKINKPEGTDKFEYNEDMLRRLADARNAKKEARRKQDMNYTPPPKTIIPDYQPQVQHSDIYASPIKTTLRDVLENFVNEITGASDEYKKIISASTEQQDEMAAERVKIWGMNNGRNPNDTGDIASMRRVLDLYRNNKASIEQNPELMQKIKLTGPIEVDTTELTKTFNEALSGKNMRNAQMGGSPLQQVLGAMRGFTFMPSIEKSRALADGLNKIFGDINKAINSVLANIQMNESILAGMEKSGEVEFDSEGYMTKGSSAAKKTLADLEESKYVFETIKADLLENEKIVKTTGNDYGKMVKLLSFTSPILRDDNTILRYLNAGLNKNGEALHFQTRLAEILNYTFQLIGRSIGQWFKRIISMLNPLNIIKNTFKTITGWIKSAFQDFGSYDTKWQRTMNVIKINFQRAIKPAMEWIAQKLVNIIGFFNIISMKVQEAFGQVPVDLFDQAGANAEKMRRELEKAANVTAGFDELHDIGSDNSGENDLLGDIYKPQLSKDWIDLANRIGDTFAHLIKGDMGFGDVCKEILRLLGELLGKIAKVIWDWFRKTSLGKWITEHWKSLLATLLTIFLAWKLLKIAGKLIWKALTSNLTGEAFGSVLGKLGVKFMDIFTATQFGSDFVRGIKAMFTSGGMIGTFKMGGASLGAVFAEALVAVIGVAIAGIAIGVGGDKMKKNTAYNQGIDSVGGDDKDKKGNAGAAIGTTLGTTAGLALTGLAIGGPIGAAIGAGIGAIAGLLTTVLAPAFEKLEVAARDANNEMQKIEYYEGAVKGAQSQVDIFDEQQQLLKQSLELSTKAVYEQGEKLGISKSRMDELVQATKDGSFTTDMLSGSETQLSGSLTDLAQKQEHTKEVTEKLEEAQKKLLKAQTELSIAQDIEAGNFELAAARIEVAEAQGVYSTEDATKKRIQLYKQGGEEERRNLLQNLTPEQRALMTQYNGVTDKETKELVKIWQESGDDIREAFLSGTDESVQREFENNMNSMDNIIKQHQGFWQKAGDTIAEIFSFGNANTWTYNAEAKYGEEKKKGKFQYKKYDVGTNYVPNDGLAYLHQGEAVIPKKYNRPYQPNDNSGLENAINQLNQQVAQISSKVNDGIAVKGEFKQRGNDLVAVVEKAKNRNGNQPLNNAVFAR